jgi:hypothetical protein
MEHLRDIPTWESLTTPDGELDRPLQAAWWRGDYSVRLEGDGLSFVDAWHLPPDMWAGILISHRPRRGLLEGFTRLAKADDPAAFVRFAQAWGPLLLCEHRLPRGHPPFAEAPREWESCRWSKWEPLSAWRDFAQKGLGILEAAAREGDAAVPAQAPGWAAQVNEWLVLGRVGLRIETMDEHYGKRARPRVVVGGDGLFGAIGVALLLAVTRTDGLAVCSACALPYVPDRGPRAGQRNYCSSCRDAGVPHRDASREWSRRHPDYAPTWRARGAPPEVD